MQSLKDTKRREIFKQFLYNNSLRFNEIEKKTNLRSNDLAYFLQKMTDEGILIKEDTDYKLTKDAEKHIPFFVDDNKLSPLPIVLIACKNKEGKILLIHRKKRPYNEHWSLPGGRIRISETIEEATIRNIKKKTFLDVDFISNNAVVHERYNDRETTKSAFVLFFVLVEPKTTIKEKPDLKWFSKEEIRTLKMIPSDQWLVLNKLNSNVEVIQESIIEEDELSMAINP